MPIKTVREQRTRKLMAARRAAQVNSNIGTQMQTGRLFPLGTQGWRNYASPSVHPISPSPAPPAAPRQPPIGFGQRISNWFRNSPLGNQTPIQGAYNLPGWENTNIQGPSPEAWALIKRILGIR